MVIVHSSYDRIFTKFQNTIKGHWNIYTVDKICYLRIISA